MKFADLRELIQDDIITVMDGYDDQIIDSLCQIVVNRFDEYLKSNDISRNLILKTQKYN